MGKKQVAKILRVGKLILGAALLLVIFSDQKSRRQNQKTAEGAREELVLAEATSSAVVAEDLFEKWSILENDMERKIITFSFFLPFSGTPSL